MTSSSDETIQIYNVKEGRHEKSLLSKKYGVKLAKFTHTSSSIIYASTKQNGELLMEKQLQCSVPPTKQLV
jgi:COMPASS component SWD2